MLGPRRSVLLLALVVASAILEGDSVSQSDSLEEALSRRFAGIRGRLQSGAELILTEERARASREEGKPRDFDSVLPLRFGEPSRFSAGRVRIAARPVRARAASGRIERGKIAYTEAFEDTDVLTFAGDEWSEELLYLRSRTAPTRFEYVVSPESPGTEMTLEDGMVFVTDASGEGVVLLPPVVLDSEGRRSIPAARVSLGSRESAGSRRLTIDVDPAGLTYPLLLDPTWTSTGSLSTGRGRAISILLQTGKVLIAAGAPTTQATAELYDPATGVWTPTGSLPVGRSELTGTLLRDGRVLIAGGSLTFGAFTTETLLYDPATGSWTPTGSLILARRMLSAVMLLDGRVLVTGGENPLNTGRAEAEIYNPATATWSSTGPMIDARSQHALTLLADGRVLAAAGRGPLGGSFSAAEIYNPATETWSPTGNLLQARLRHTATRLADGRVLVAGGGSTPTTTAETFDPATGLWSSAPSMATARALHTASLLPSGKVLVTGGGTAATEIFDPALPGWSSAGNMSASRNGHNATILPNGKVLVATSWTGGLATADLFDPDVGSWSSGASLTLARGEHSATPLRTGKVLIAGGVSTPNQAEVYDPSLNSWAATGNLDVGRYRHTATLLGDGHVLAAGSVTSAADGKTAETYDPSGGTWSRTGDLVTNRYDHAATLLACGEVLVAGGESSSGVVLQSSERFHPVSRKWRSTGSLVTGRGSHTATLLYDGRVLVTGGWNAGTLASAEIYDPATETWSATGSMSTPRYRHTATLLPNGKVLVAGGWNGGSLASAELYNPTTGLFTATGAMPTAHDSHTALLLPNGRVLAAGGSGTATADLYDPATGAWTSTASLSKARDEHTMTLLTMGQVLVAGGTNPVPDAETELYDVGRGESASFRPVIGSSTDPWVDGSALSVTGTGFQGISEASSGIEGRNSATNYPLVQIQRLDNEAVFFVPVRPGGGWTSTGFLSPSMSPLVPGPAQVTVFTNGIPSVARNIGIECAAPSITLPPAPQSVCEGGAATLDTATTAECPAYQWRFSGSPLSDGGRISGAQAQTLTITPVALSDAGDYDVIAAAACSSATATSPTASLTVVPVLAPNTISATGATSVCTSCTGGTATESHSGGGASTYQWGFRAVPLGAMTGIPGETGSSYVINGGHFPGPGTYFLVARTTPTCGTTQTSNEITVTVSDSVPTDTVQFFTVTSKDGENVLEWLYPPGFGTVRVSVRQGSPGCTFPTDPLDPTIFLSDESGAPGGRDLLTHSSLTNDVFYCYTLFVDLGGGTYSAGRSNRGYPFDTSGDVKWSYSVGTTSMAPPGLGAGAIYAVANDNAIHSMLQGASGGTWPAAWKPKAMMGPSQGRPVSIGVTAGGFNPVIFLSSQDGHAYAFSAAGGDQAWMSPLLGTMVTGAPSGMFVLFGGGERPHLRRVAKFRRQHSLCSRRRQRRHRLAVLRRVSRQDRDHHRSGGRRLHERPGLLPELRALGRREHPLGHEARRDARLGCRPRERFDGCGPARLHAVRRLRRLHGALDRRERRRELVDPDG